VSATGPRPSPAFTTHADAYAHSAVHAMGEDLERLVALARERLGPLEGRRVVDVATGAGHTARVFALAGARVTALDPSPEMRAVARRHLAKAAPDAEVELAEGSAEALLLADDCVDLVTCRIAAHHFEDPRRFLAEVRRVLAPGGLLLLVDNVPPESPSVAARMNEIERLRDPGHVQAYPVSTWVAWVAGAGLEPFVMERFWRVKALADWLQRAGTAPDRVEALHATLDACDPRARAYLVTEQDAAGRATRLRHEVMLLGASRPV